MNKFITKINGLDYAKDSLTGQMLRVKGFKNVSSLPSITEDNFVYILEDGVHYYKNIMNIRQVKLEEIKREEKELHKEDSHSDKKAKFLNGNKPN